MNAHAHGGPPKPLLRHRKNVDLLLPNQLSALREGFRRLQEISDNVVTDNRGYQYLAGLHGLPDQFCQHGDPPGSDPLFLPWHRAYLYMFELAMRDQVPDAALAWWDWTSDASHANGIPRAFAPDEVDGEPNPLHRASIQPAARQPNGRPAETGRGRRDPSGLPTAERVREALSSRSFSDFTAQLEDLHNRVHGWVGGTMAYIPWAAYDPIFWAHHTNIDRLWRIWQLRHPQRFSARFMNQALPPFPLTVEDTLNIKALGYDYASSTTHVAGTNA